MDADGRAAARARKRETREAWSMFAAMVCSGVLYAVAGVVFVVLLASPGRVRLVLCTVFLAAGIARRFRRSCIGGGFPPLRRAILKKSAHDRMKP